MSILEIYDYFKTKQNASFNYLSQLINTLSNQEFGGLDTIKGKFGKNEGNTYIAFQDKSNRNETSISNFLSSPIY